MAIDNALTCITLVAAADLSAKQFCGIKIDSNGKAALAGEDTLAIGILQNNPEADQAARVAVGGISKVLAGGTVTRGSAFSFDVNGKAIAVGSGLDWAMGTVMESLSAGKISSVLIQSTGPTL